MAVSESRCRSTGIKLPWRTDSQHEFPGDDRDRSDVQDKAHDDGGYWLAQMKYDELKNKLGKEQDELSKAGVGG